MMEGQAFQRVVQRIRFLVEMGARHKRGFRLSDMTDMLPLIHLIEEVSEVMWEEERQRPIRERVMAVQSVDADKKDVLAMNIADDRIKAELGDALGCWLHYVIRKGFLLEDLLERYNDSLVDDFPGAFPAAVEEREGT